MFDHRVHGWLDVAILEQQSAVRTAFRREVDGILDNPVGRLTTRWLVLRDRINEPPSSSVKGEDVRRLVLSRIQHPSKSRDGGVGGTWRDVHVSSPDRVQ
jgi:hypothetical protein